MDTAPEFGLTLGMQDILFAKKILLLISGKKKKSITERLLQRKVTTDLPASFLWLHNNVECIIDKNVMLN
jgi:galactosamine-6-phosphate isomerase